MLCPGSTLYRRDVGEFRATFKTGVHAQDLVVLPLTISFAMGTLATLALPLDSNVCKNRFNDRKGVPKLRGPTFGSSGICYRSIRKAFLVMYAYAYASAELKGTCLARSLKSERI